MEVEGKIISIEKCWKNLGQRVYQEGERCSRFTLTTSPFGRYPLKTEGFIFEVEAPINSSLLFKINGKKFVFKVSEILKKSYLIGFLSEARKLAYEKWGFEGHYRKDPFWHHAYKFKIHQGIPEAGYKAKFTYQENLKEKKEDYYMVKVVQKDGSYAWSSPIWVR